MRSRMMSFQFIWLLSSLLLIFFFFEQYISKAVLISEKYQLLYSFAWKVIVAGRHVCFTHNPHCNIWYTVYDSKKTFRLEYMRQHCYCIYLVSGFRKICGIFSILTIIDRHTKANDVYTLWGSFKQLNDLHW